jgi:hypothetical protein
MPNEPIVEPIVDGTEGVVDAGAGNEPKPVALKDEDLVEIQVNGERIVKPWKEARAEMQMRADYTRKTQGVAAQAKELKELYDALKNREGSVAEKEAAIDRILGRQPNPATAKPDPDEVITRAQMQEILAEDRKAMEASFSTRLTESSTKADQARLYQRWEDLTTNTVDSLLKEQPILKSIPQLSLVLKREALEDKPQTEQEMTAAIVKAGKRIAAGLDSAYAERKKEEAVRKQSLTTKGAEPAGGHALLTPSKKSYGDRGKINFDELEKDVLAAIEASQE